MCNTWINVKGNDNGIISNNNTLTHQRTTKTHKNFLADRWAFDDVAVSTSRAKQRLATSGTTWLIVELRRLDLSLEILFRSFFLSCYIDRRVNDGLLFKFSKEFQWNWMRHAEKVNDLLFFCSRFFYQFFCVYIIVTMVRAQLCYSYGEKPSDYLWNERIENCEAVFVLFGCSFYWISVWFNLHEILAVDTKREVKIILYLPWYGRYFL